MDIYKELLYALEQEERVMLATIIATTGSTPASAFSKMLVKQGGLVSVGTVGGGCMEGDVLLHAHRLYYSGRAEVLTFHLNEDAVEHGLICGGTLDILIEPITREQQSIFKELKSLRDDGRDCVLVTFLKNGGGDSQKFIVQTDDPEKWNSGVMENMKSNIPSFQHSISELVQRTHHRQQTTRFKTDNDELILEPIAGTPGLLIFGGGHVSKYVSRTASMAGFHVTIIDDREKYANSQRFPEAVRTLAVDYMDAFKDVEITASTFIVIVTRGHRYDEEILFNALKTPASYIGMIGSKRKVMTTFEHLLERGISLESLKRVHAPIGVDIGALTAEEIGVSIVAELISVRRGAEDSVRHKSDAMKEIFHQLEGKFSKSVTV